MFAKIIPKLFAISPFTIYHSLVHSPIEIHAHIWHSIPFSIFYFLSPNFQFVLYAANAVWLTIEYSSMFHCIENDLMHISMRSFTCWDTKYPYSIWYVSHTLFYTYVDSIHSNSVHYLEYFFSTGYAMAYTLLYYHASHWLHTAQSSLNIQKSYQCNVICNWGSHFENWNKIQIQKTLKCIRWLAAEELRVLTFQNLSLKRASYPVNDSYSYSSSGLIQNIVSWNEAFISCRLELFSLVVGWIDGAHIFYFSLFHCQFHVEFYEILFFMQFRLFSKK